MVKVKILCSVGPHKEGDVIEVDEATAAHLLAPVVTNWGHEQKVTRKALSMDEVAAEEAALLGPEGTGKTVTQAPQGDDFEKRFPELVPGFSETKEDPKALKPKGKK